MINKTIISLILIFLANCVSADNVYSTKINRLMLDKNHGEKVFIRLESPNALHDPSCHDGAANNWDFVIQLSSSLDKTFYSTLLAAHTAGRIANFYGTGDCSVYSRIETLRRIELK